MSNALRILTEVRVVGGKVEFAPPDSLRVAAPPALVEQVKAHKQEIIRYLSEPLALDCDAFAERAAIIEANGVPRAWAEGFALLCTMPRPSAYAPERWQQIVDDGGKFLDRWGRQAAGLGWKATDVFGVNPDAPENRYDSMGLVSLLEGHHVIAITADTVRIDSDRGAQTTFYRKTISAETVALWKMETK